MPVVNAIEYQVFYNITQSPAGEFLLINGERFYAVATEVCPLCGRVGQRATEFDSEMIMHVLVFNVWPDGTEHAPVWVVDLCHLDRREQVLSNPVRACSNRIKHPFEIQQGDSNYWAALDAGYPGVRLSEKLL